ncbi:magnesium transporter [Paenibacillus sp. 1001270B_150601_E10]|uniref:magnesium transporter n=1 Tax=Paenibacillus sp. 1001270B_150601_E10 TaxID=2787079 RepID=UPI003B641D4B
MSEMDKREKRSREQHLKELSRAVERKIRQGQSDQLRAQFEDWEPYDLAIMFKELEEDVRSSYLELLDIESLADAISELEPEAQIEALYMLGKVRAAQVLNRMDNDDLADMMAEVPDEIQEYMLSIMEAKERENVQELMTYGSETAGGIMTNRYVWFKESFTVREAVEKVKQFAELTNDVQYLYVVNEQKSLIGMVTYRDLVLSPENEIIMNLMQENIISVTAETDQEEVAHLFEKYDLVSLPVVDAYRRLIGVITFDDVLDVLREEANEDINKLAGTDKTIDFRTPALVAARRRLPWLIMLLFLGLVSGSIMSQFEDTLNQVVALIFFMPMIAGMTGNTGTQSLAVVIRGLGSHRHLDRQTIVRLFWRELSVGLMIGIVCGISIALIAGIWQNSFPLGIVVGFSLFLTIVIGTMAGTIIPVILYKMKLDPAVASGPLITTLNDIFSLTVYFGTATIFLQYLL